MFTRSDLVPVCVHTHSPTVERENTGEDINDFTDVMELDQTDSAYDSLTTGVFCSPDSKLKVHCLPRLGLASEDVGHAS